ncbi:hypothetical protein JNW90_10715 [Micromonospora sp. STR1s_5]|nr:hypothetical protein [Micromonospora sp. STR1s_5]
MTSTPTEPNDSSPEQPKLTAAYCAEQAAQLLRKAAALPNDLQHTVTGGVHDNAASESARLVNVAGGWRELAVAMATYPYHLSGPAPEDEDDKVNARG